MHQIANLINVNFGRKGLIGHIGKIQKYYFRI